MKTVIFLKDNANEDERSTVTEEQKVNEEEEYALEIPVEVLKKIRSAERSDSKIPEESIRNLRYVDVSRSRYNSLKRIADVVFSTATLIVLAIPLIILCLVVYIDDPGKVIFSQNRVGRFGKRFRLYKIRTMRIETPKYLSTMELSEPGKYITRVGRAIRKYSLDEIPQLINVLKGDMSIVGPRPLISDEFEVHNVRMRFGVYNIRPGVTGLAQVNGRDYVTPVEKVHWDVLYLENFGPIIDLKILLASFPKVLGGVDVAIKSTNNEHNVKK